LLLVVPVGTRNSFFGIYRKFEYVPSKRFATPGLIACSRKIILKEIGVILKEWYFYSWRRESYSALNFLDSFVPSFCL